MIATFSITDKDLIAQQKNAIKKTKFHKKSRIMYLITFFILFMFILITAGYSTGHLIFGFILNLIISPLVWKSYEYANVNRFKREIIKQHKNKIGTFTLDLSEERLTKESKNLTEKFKWDELDRFTEDEERYFLYLTDLSAITIKKEPNNMNEEEIIEYQSFIKRKVNNELNNKT